MLPPTSLLTVDGQTRPQLLHEPAPPPLRHPMLPLLYVAESYRSIPSPPPLFPHVQPLVRRAQKSSSWDSSQKPRRRTHTPLLAFHRSMRYLSPCTPTELLPVSRLVTLVV